MAEEHKYGWRGGEDSHFLCCRHDHLSFGGQALFIDRFPKHVFSDRFPCIHALLYIHASSHIHSYRLSSILLPHIHEDSLVCVCVLVVSVTVTVCTRCLETGALGASTTMSNDASILDLAYQPCAKTSKHDPCDARGKGLLGHFEIQTLQLLHLA